MLFSFPKIDHPATRFQDHIAHFFGQIFKLNPQVFDKKLLIHPDFHPIVDNSGKLIGILEEIVARYNSLNLNQRNELKKAFDSNTCIKCYSDKSIKLVKYEELPFDITEKLRELFDYLWKDFPLVQEGERLFSTVKNHYDEITKDIKICPFCGLYAMVPNTSKKREDYDHILPKAQYPFVSVNFDFVVPTCDDCNTNEKKSKDPAYDSGNKRRLFYYPYDLRLNYQNLSINIKPKEQFNSSESSSLLQSISWDYEIKRNNIETEELNTWNDIYRVKGRYREFTKSYEKEWFDELVRHYKKEKRKNTGFETIKDEFIEELEYQAVISPFGVIKHSYFEYILSMNDIEERLNEAIGISTQVPEPANQ